MLVNIILSLGIFILLIDTYVELSLCNLSWFYIWSLWTPYNRFLQVAIINTAATIIVIIKNNSRGLLTSFQKL